MFPILSSATVTSARRRTAAPCTSRPAAIWSWRDVAAMAIPFCSGRSPQPWTAHQRRFPLQERMDTMLRHVRLILECNPQKPPEVAIREARKHAAWYMTGMRGAAQFRNRCYHLESYAQAEQLAEDFLRMQEEDGYHEA